MSTAETLTSAQSDCTVKVMNSNIVFSENIKKAVASAKIRRNIFFILIAAGLLPYLAGFISSYIDIKIPESLISEMNAELIGMIAIAGGSLLLIAAVIGLEISRKRSHKKITPMVYQEVLDQTMPGVFFNADSGFSREELSMAGILNFDHRTKSESKYMISGIYNGMQFSMASFKIHNHSFWDSSGDERHRTYRTGGTMYRIHCDSLRQYAGRVMISGYFLAHESPFVKYHINCKSGDPEFDKFFNIHADTESSVNSVLTPKRTEYIKSLTAFTRNTYLCFDCIHGNLYIMLADKSFTLDTRAYSDPNPENTAGEIIKSLNILRYSIDELL